MQNNKLLNKSEEFFPITKFNKNNFNHENCVSFSGSPLRHPYDDEKFILISDPLSEHTNFIEFNKKDVIFAEELSSILSLKSESIPMNRVWIKIGSIGVRYEPFIVGKTKDVIDSLNKKK